MKLSVSIQKISLSHGSCEECFRAYLAELPAGFSAICGVCEGAAAVKACDTELSGPAPDGGGFKADSCPPSLFYSLVF